MLTSPERLIRKAYNGMLFVRQANMLFSKGFDRESSIGRAEFIKQLRPLKKLASNVANQAATQIPFLIVIPNAIVSISQQMELLEFSDSEGQTSLDDAGFRSLYLGACTDRLYLAYHVSSASDFSGTSFDFSRDVIERGEFGLTAEEGIALARNNPGVLLGAPMALVGSRHGQSNRVPFLVNQPSHGPRLLSKAEDAKDLDPHVFPKCAGRLS